LLRQKFLDFHSPKSCETVLIELNFPLFAAFTSIPYGAIDMEFSPCVAKRKIGAIY
jgi:hypothetical protein